MQPYIQQSPQGQFRGANDVSGLDTLGRSISNIGNTLYQFTELKKDREFRHASTQGLSDYQKRLEELTEADIRTKFDGDYDRAYQETWESVKQENEAVREFLERFDGANQQELDDAAISDGRRWSGQMFARTEAMRTVRQTQESTNSLLEYAYQINPTDHDTLFQRFREHIEDANKIGNLAAAKQFQEAQRTAVEILLGRLELSEKNSKAFKSKASALIENAPPEYRQKMAESIERHTKGLTEVTPQDQNLASFGLEKLEMGKQMTEDEQEAVIKVATNGTDKERARAQSALLASFTIGDMKNRLVSDHTNFGADFVKNIDTILERGSEIWENLDPDNVLTDSSRDNVRKALAKWADDVLEKVHSGRLVEVYQDDPLVQTALANGDTKTARDRIKKMAREAGWSEMENNPIFGLTEMIDSVLQRNAPTSERIRNLQSFVVANGSGAFRAVEDAIWNADNLKNEQLKNKLQISAGTLLPVLFLTDPKTGEFLLGSDQLQGFMNAQFMQFESGNELFTEAKSKVRAIASEDGFMQSLLTAAAQNNPYDPRVADAILDAFSNYAAAEARHRGSPEAGFNAAKIFFQKSFLVGGDELTGYNILPRQRLTINKSKWDRRVMGSYAFSSEEEAYTAVMDFLDTIAYDPYDPVTQKRPIAPSDPDLGVEDIDGPSVSLLSMRTHTPRPPSFFRPMDEGDMFLANNLRARRFSTEGIKREAPQTHFTQGPETFTRFSKAARLMPGDQNNVLAGFDDIKDAFVNFPDIDWEQVDLVLPSYLAPSTVPSDTREAYANKLAFFTIADGNKPFRVGRWRLTEYNGEMVFAMTVASFGDQPEGEIRSISGSEQLLRKKDGTPAMIIPADKLFDAVTYYREKVNRPLSLFGRSGPRYYTKQEKRSIPVFNQRKIVNMNEAEPFDFNSEE